MMKQPSISFVLMLIIVSFLSGCDLTPPDSDLPESVIFTVSVDTELFSDEGSLRVSLWNADQMEIMKRNADCAISYNLETQTEEIHCPEGVEYQEVFPEEFTFPLQEIGEIVEVKSKKISIGERYRLQISGLSSDDCNTTSANVEGVAQRTHVTLEDLMWMSTMMACP
jgi:hypothetical protein